MYVYLKKYSTYRFSCVFILYSLRVNDHYILVIAAITIAAQSPIYI